jgi:hypothetical protein
MKLSKRTLSILSNFAGFNGNILINEGSVLKTMTEQRNVFATATVEEQFPREVPIYNLPELLKAINLFNDPDIQFNDTHIQIADAQSSIKYFYADKSVITYPTKEIKLPAFDLNFDLTTEKFNRVMSGAKTLGLPTISLLNQDGKLILRAHDAQNESSNKFDVILGDDATSGEFLIHFKIEHLSLLEVDYKVSVSFKGIAQFSNEKENLAYAVGLQPAKVPTKKDDAPF